MRCKPPLPDALVTIVTVVVTMVTERANLFTTLAAFYQAGENPQYTPSFSQVMRFKL